MRGGRIVVLICVLGAAVAASLGVSTCARDDVAPTVAAPARHPNILLFTIDTLRADHIHAQGYARETSPTMDAIATRGTLFTRAYSTASWTLPAVASLMSGVLPSQHGVTHTQAGPDGGAQQDVLSIDLPSLPALLHAVGYRTIGVTSNGHLAGEAGFSRGFDQYRCSTLADVERMRPAVWEQLDALRDGDAPYFLWVHVTDPHLAYEPRDPQFDAYWGASRARHQELDQALYLTGIEPVATTLGLSVEETLEYATAAYDSEIRAADDFLRDIVEALDDENLAIVITSDHGEELNDHGNIGHGTTLFEETVHVPLIVALPSQTPSVVRTPVQIIDVLPTLADLADGDATGAAGISLVPALRGESLPTRDLLLESGRAFPVIGLVNERYKYGELSMPHRFVQRLFDLSADPGEVTDLVPAQPALADDLAERVHTGLAAARALRGGAAVERVTISADVVAHLRALGYAE